MTDTLVKKKLLFVTERFDDDSGKHISNSQHNVFDTCINSGLFELDNLYVDVDRTMSTDDRLLMAMLNQSYDGVIFSFLADHRNILNPSIDVLTTIKETFPNIPLFFLWWDSVYQQNRNIIYKLEGIASLQINFDHSDISIKDMISSSVPQNEQLFYPDKHIHDISFVGRVHGYPQRTQYVQYLQSHIDVNVRGGKYVERLSEEEYAKEIRQSSINLNFCQTAGGLIQCKGRVWEILASKTLLLEQDNPLTKQYLEDNKHCIYFTSPKDLLEKIQYYLNHVNECETIANSGYEIYKQKYNYVHFWNRIYNLV